MEKKERKKKREPQNRFHYFFYYFFNTVKKHLQKSTNVLLFIENLIKNNKNKFFNICSDLLKNLFLLP